MENVTVSKFEQTSIPQTFYLTCQACSWDVTLDETVWWAKTCFSGITDFLRLKKHKDRPHVVLIQDLKGNRIAYAAVQWIPAEDENEAATGNWTYYWSYDCDTIPEDAEIDTIDNLTVQQMVIDRGYSLCKLIFGKPAFVSQLAVYLFNIIKDTLDQQAVEEGHTWVIELDGYFEAAVEVVGGEKQFSILPKGEMKTLIKDDAGSEN